MYGGVRGKASALVLGVFGFIIGAGAPATAADLGGDCCADLEERVAELEATAARKGNRKVSLQVGGYINEALLFWDDGKEQDVYEGTNHAARSRFRFLGDAKINSEWSAGYLLEIGVITSRLNRVNQNTSDGFSNFPTTPGLSSPSVPVSASGLDIRQSTWWIQSTKLGRVWIGQTDQATERITEINLSATNLFLKHYGRWNGSFILRNKSTGALVGTNTWGQILPQNGSTGEGVPGEGDRYNLVKYDSPEFGGFVVSAAWGEDDFWDAAVRYAGEFDGVKVAAGIGYSDWVGQGSLNARGCAIVKASAATSAALGVQYDDGKSDCSQLGLSASILHEKSGLFVTGSYGIKWDENRDASFQAVAASAKSVEDEDQFYQVLGGVEKKFDGELGKLGKTTIYAEYEHYDTGAILSANSFTATGRPRLITGKLGAGADIDVWGAGVNQNIEKAALDLYVAYRRAEADVFLSNTGVKGDTGADTLKIEPIHLLMTGARIQF